jgi:hypothetical protein
MKSFDIILIYIQILQENTLASFNKKYKLSVFCVLKKLNTRKFRSNFCICIPEQTTNLLTLTLTLTLTLNPKLFT